MAPHFSFFSLKFAPMLFVHDFRLWMRLDLKACCESMELQMHAIHRVISKVSIEVQVLRVIKLLPSSEYRPHSIIDLRSVQNSVQ